MPIELLYNEIYKTAARRITVTETYEQHVARFEKIDSTQAQQWIDDGREAVLYIWKAVCRFPELDQETIDIVELLSKLNSKEKRMIKNIMKEIFFTK